MRTLFVPEVEFSVYINSNLLDSNGEIDPTKLDLVARMGGDWYSRVTKESMFTINNGDRIAQAVVASVFAKNVINLVSVSNISDDTERGSGGFGSTGLK